MRARKERLTVTIDRDLLEVAEEAVAFGEADSVSAWVNAALAERADKERRLRALAKAVAAYEAEFGAFTEEEIAEQRRLDRANAIVVRGDPRKAKKPRAKTKKVTKAAKSQPRVTKPRKKSLA
jgi:hypothetical protein